MSVGVKAAVPPHPRPTVETRAAVFPIRHVRQAAGRYRQFTLLRCEFIDKSLNEAYDSF